MLHPAVKRHTREGQGGGDGGDIRGVSKLIEKMSCRRFFLCVGKLLVSSGSGLFTSAIHVLEGSWPSQWAQ